MIKFVYVIRRRPELTPEEFQTYWREKHAPLVQEIASDIGLTRYVQLFHREHPIEVGAREARGMGEPYDGIAELYAESEEALAAVFSTPEGQAAMGRAIEDEAKFVDLANSTLFLVDEVEVPLP